MRRIPPAPALLLAPLLLLATSCGGGDGGTDPLVVASVVITAPAAPPSFQTLGRTVAFSASARDAANSPIATAVVTWSSSNPAAATVNLSSGIVTAVANGATNITANSGAIASASVLVTVAQVVDTVNPTPVSVEFGALGSTRQLAAVAVDSSDAPVAGAPAVVWTVAGTGTDATVSPTGLATAISVGITDTAIATVGTKSARIPISVTQVVATVDVTPIAPETLRTTTRTKQYTAVPKDSQANVMANAVTWSSTSTGVATIDAGTGLATAIADGTTAVIASAGGKTGQRNLVVLRYPATFTMTPSAASITVNDGTQVFTGTAQDTLANNLTINWLSKNTAVLTVTPNSGTQTTAEAAGNGLTYVVIVAGQRRDSAEVTVTNQAPAIPAFANVTVGNNFFRSVRNNTQDMAIDTISVNGEVTWQWAGAGPAHQVISQGAPNFPSSPTQSAGDYQRVFTAIGVYNYVCSIHSSMTGRIVVLNP